MTRSSMWDPRRVVRKVNALVKVGDLNVINLHVHDRGHRACPARITQGVHNIHGIGIVVSNLQKRKATHQEKSAVKSA
jgi:hypothetical protein